MPQLPARIAGEAGIAFSNITDAAAGLVTPTLRLGVTGLSGAGKTIFITALVHNLLTGGRLPGFAPLAEGRLIGASLSEHPDRHIPRFAYEQHLAALTGTPPQWPQSTRRVSQLRLTLKYQSADWFKGLAGPRRLHLDIIDYPGEWLLDLPLLSLGFSQWSTQALERARRPASKTEAKPFLDALAASDPHAQATEPAAEALAGAFARYLRASREDGRALSTLPPGRFLLPGDLEGSPALTFAPLPPPIQKPHPSSLYAMLARRYEAYKSKIVRPFFRDHFARLDRQIVMVDALRALNAGPDAVADLEGALSEILTCFRAGSGNPLIRLFARRIDRILFAATKADHLHQSAHQKLDAIINHLVGNAARRSKFAGARTRSIGLAAIRATREGTIKDKGKTLECIVGTPMAGQMLGGETYDGKTEIGFYPGDLPDNPDSVFEDDAGAFDLKFLRFMPPAPLARNHDGSPVLPHIRLDSALDFLIGDWLK